MVLHSGIKTLDDYSKEKEEIKKRNSWNLYQKQMDLKDNLSSDPVVNQVINLFRNAVLSQKNKGLDKYGQTISEAKLSDEELTKHALEEAIDLLVYLQARKKKLNIEELAKISYGQSNWELVAEATRQAHRETASRIKDYLIGANII